MSSNKYKILPVKIKKNTSKKWANVDPRLPAHPFALLVAAPPKSGKSNFLVAMLLLPDFAWLDKFDKVVICSPTILSDLTMAPIVEISKDEENPLSEKLKIFSGDDLDNIDELVKMVIADQKENPEQETLLILDDCIGMMKGGLFGRTYAKYRHDNLSILGTSQMFKAFDPISRASSNGLILFKTHNEKERVKIMEELAGFPNIEKYYDEATEKKHNFLWVNIQQQELWHNFDDLLWKK
jgi:hypothetical protein